MTIDSHQREGVVFLIQARDLTKRYGDKPALDHVNFTIESGQVVGLLGLNGAGKSTTMNILTGYISATEGTVSIGGHDIVTASREAKRITGYLPEQPAFYPEMRVKEHLSFICDLKGVTKNRKEHIADVCGLVGIGDMQGRIIRNLSKGYRQRVGFAQALIGNPQVIILDEPTVGLDPSQIIEIRQLIKDAGKRSTVIVSSHILTEIQAVCSRIILLQKGRVIADGLPDELVGQLGGDRKLRVRIKGESAKIQAALQKVPGVRGVKRLSQTEPGAWDFALESAGDEDIRVPLFRALSAADLPLLATQGGDRTLEDLFLQLTAGQDTPREEESPS